MEDPLYLQHEEHSCKILYIWHVMPIFSSKWFIFGTLIVLCL